MRSNVTVYEYVERPDVEVEVGGKWLPGEVRMRWQDGDGAWWANVRLRPAGSNSRKFDNLPADRVRLPA